MYIITFDLTETPNQRVVWYSVCDIQEKFRHVIHEFDSMYGSPQFI